jgi:nucleoid DNA-binding protein
MNLENYISQLLYRYQCVTIPGFGAFLTDIQSAQWNEANNGFYPPKKLISFNSFLKNNDGLLANHVAQNEKISYESALVSIENQVIKWKNDLQSANKISFKSIGEFNLNSEKNIVFTPYEQVNYLTSSFGLTSLIAPSIKREVIEHLFDDVKEEEVIQLVSDRNIGRTYLKYAAVIVLSLSFTGIMGLKLYQEKVVSDTLIVQTEVQKQVQNTIQEATFVISNPLPSVTLAVKEENMPYHIVAGAFRLEKNAEKVYKRLTRKGYKAKRLAPNSIGLFPVLYGSFPSLEEAERIKSDIQKSENPNAWILIEQF